MTKTFGYARVSSKDQNPARQLEAFKAIGIDTRDIITDKASGKNTDRDGYRMLKTQLLRDGDILVIKSLDRLCRSKKDTKQELEWFKENGIKLKILDIPSTMVDYPEGQEWIGDMVNNILIEVLASISENERITIRQRQAEGTAAEPINNKGKKYSARTGREHGRPNIVKPTNFDEVYAKWKVGEMTATQAMYETRMKKTSFYKLVKIKEGRI